MKTPAWQFSKAANLHEGATWGSLKSIDPLNSVSNYYVVYEQKLCQYLLLSLGTSKCFRCDMACPHPTSLFFFCCTFSMCVSAMQIDWHQGWTEQNHATFCMIVDCTCTCFEVPVLNCGVWFSLFARENQQSCPLALLTQSYTGGYVKCTQ